MEESKSSTKMAEGDVRLLKNRRRALKCAMTRMETFVDKEITKVGECMLLARREKLISNYTDYENTSLKISLLDESDEDDVAGVEEKYFCMLSKIDDRLKELRRSEVTGEPDGHVASRVNSQLPTLDILRFDGKDFTKYKPFMDIFKAVVDNNIKISNVEKLCYLHKYLAGEALAVIINLPLINESYSEALLLLDKRFHNNARLITSHINILLDLQPIQKGTAANIRNFLAQIQQQIYALKNLEQPVHNWDMLLLSILSRKLDTYTNRAYHLDKENPLELPTLNEFISFLEKRAMALEDSPTERISNYFDKPKNSKVNNSIVSKIENECKFCKKDGTANVNLLCSKSRVAPLNKTLTIPQLCLEPKHVVYVSCLC